MANLLTKDAALKQARHMHGLHLRERESLDFVRRYWKGRQKLPAVIPIGTPKEVHVMERSSRVNVMPIVINSLVQSTFVEGFRSKGGDENEEVYEAWLANGMKGRQSGIHRAAFGYGTSYAIVLPGEPEPTIRGKSPRQMFCLYGDDPDWPLWALERRRGGVYRLFDDNAVYTVYLAQRAAEEDAFVKVEEHGLGVCPVVRYLDEEDLDDEDEVEPEGSLDCPITRGQIAPLVPLQDQIDLTTFGLQIAQHYTGFRQRYIIGWVGETEGDTLKVGANRIVAIDESPEGEDGVKVGEFSQTDLTGFLESREATLRHAATLSQTPVHELIGELVNLSAEALAAAEAGRDRKVDERQTTFGQSHARVFSLVGRCKNVTVSNDAEVRWRDTSARAFAATVDGLGKLAQMLEVPPEMLWERIPGVTSTDLARWKRVREEGDSFQRLTEMFERQAA